MIHYILLVITFQVLFLIIYDLFLKRETFFQWNRGYLMVTFLLSLVLPFVKIAAFSTEVSQQFSAIVLPELILTPENTTIVTANNFSWWQLFFIVGAAISAFFFIYKILEISRLKQKGKIQKFSDYIKVIIPNSTIAFSFYRTVFLGEEVAEKDEAGILKHELVHIKQRHTLDLLFFELMRVVFWFNPLVYVYQSRIAELHEFIADAHVGKDNKKEQYQLLLSQIFQSKNISFINHFYKSSLIKKRIVMLQKSKSSKILKFKYLLMLPLIVGMLFYTSCEVEGETETNEESEIIEEVVVVGYGAKLDATKAALGNEIFEVVEVVEGVPFVEGVDVPFSTIEEPPVFPGCENAENKRACFRKQLNNHIKKHFRYPEKAQESGIQGRVSVMFLIGEDGSISNIKMKGPDALLEDEAFRIVSKLPQMTAGRQNGKDVRVPFLIPITFRLQ